jgi:hypothetical protein
MNPSTTLRIVAACASLCITFVLFSAVTSLAETPQPRLGVQLAKSPVAPAHGSRPLGNPTGGARQPKLPA